MPSIILPRRSFGQPQGLRRVDPRWAPVYVGSAGAGFVNQAAPSVQPAIAGASLVAIQSGVAYRNTSSAFSVNTRQGAFPAGQDSARTFVVQYIMRGAGGNAFGRLIEKRNAGSQIENLIHNSGSIRYERTGSGGTQSCWVSAGGATTIGQLNTLVISVPEFATGSPTAALSGVAVTPDNATAGFGTATTNTDEYYIGNRGDGTRNWDGEIALVAMLGRAVSQADAIALSADPWQLFRQPERRLYFDVPAGAATVQTDGTIRWSLVSSVQAAQALRWSLSAAVQRDTSLLWSLLKSVQSDSTARWSLIQAINADAALRWNLVQVVQGDAALSWALLSAVSADSALAWNLAGALGVVSSELALRWSALAPVSVSADLHWHLLNAVAHDIALPWNAVQAIAADGALRWALVQALQADLTAAWRMVTAVSVDSVLAWDLAAALGIVATSLDLRWSLIARVQQAIEARWSLLASVGADADMRWDIVAGVVRELILRWDSVATLIADNTLDLSWSLIAVSETDLVLRWQVGEVFDLVVRKRFVAGAATRRIFTAGASTCRSFVA